MKKQYAIWVENTHSNFGEYPYNPERYNTFDEAEKAFDAIFDQENVRLLQDAGLYFSIKEI